MINKLIVEGLIKEALIEDNNYMDMATDLLFDEADYSEAYMVAKEAGVIAGLEVAKQVFSILDPALIIKTSIKDGEWVDKGSVFLTISGPTASILKGERIALNFLQRMSGIASLTHTYVEEVKDYPVEIVDTRKTTPLLRILEKYAVYLGGGKNHRYNLSDCVMIKDNHIDAAGSITAAVRKIRESLPHTMKIEVEVKDLNECKEALEIGADIIMLDNMTDEEMTKAVQLGKGKAIFEASGNVSLPRLKGIAKTGVNVISVGALTHSYKSMDISLRFDKK